MNRFVSILAALITSVAVPPAEAVNFQQQCLASPVILGQCFVVHGSLTVADGTPTFRIWKIGTNRILGVLDYTGTKNEDSQILPLSVWSLLKADPFGTTVDGDYKVCPLTKSEPDQMQMVCMAGAEHLIVAPKNTPL